MATLLTKVSFDDYLRDARIKALPVDGLKGAKILIDPLNKRVALEVACSSIPDLTLTERLSWNTLEETQGNYVGELSVWAEQQMFEAYLLVADIAAEFIDLGDIQLALESATKGFSELLQTNRVLSLEKQIGLLGELLVLRDLIQLGKTDALNSWLGPEGGEHDFKFVEFDLEVKTTISEKRSHRIGSLSQLTPSGDRTLLLASVQLTRTTGALGFNIAELVDWIKSNSDSTWDQLAEKLQHCGWREDHTHLYTARFELRSEPLTFRVDSNFPRLMSETLELSEELMPRISEVSYRVDLESLDFLESMAQTLERSKVAG